MAEKGEDFARKLRNYAEEWGGRKVKYIEHIRAMSDEDFAYFLNFLQPEIELFALAMERTLKYKRSFNLGEHNLNGDARSLYITLQKDYEEVMQRIANNINENAH